MGADDNRSLAAWLALAHRSALPTPDLLRKALGEGPDPSHFPPDVIAREEEDVAALEELGVRLVTIRDPLFPAALKESGVIVLQVAGRADLLHELDEGVQVQAGHRGLGELLDRGDRVVVVLAKGLLKAKTLLRGLHDALEDGQVALVSAEPPRAAWGPLRDQHRDALVRCLGSGTERRTDP